MFNNQSITEIQSLHSFVEAILEEENDDSLYGRGFFESRQNAAPVNIHEAARVNAYAYIQASKPSEQDEILSSLDATPSHVDDHDDYQHDHDGPEGVGNHFSYDGDFV